MNKPSQALLELCQSVIAKRPKTVINHILEHGFTTTEELKEKYGYNHPPRAVRDVRENGIPIETFRVTGSDGRKIAAYRLGEYDKQSNKKLSGRTGLSKKIREALIQRHSSKCFIYLEAVDERELQIDHRVPFGVDGDGKELNPENFMLLSASAKRAKSWSCEHCENWQGLKDKQICISCYWAYPENYSHIAMHQIRRIDLLWEGDEVAIYENLKAQAINFDQEIPAFVKSIIEQALEKIKP
jgi:hypothetical protein